LIEERLATYPQLSAVRLLEECSAAGYAGGYSQLKAYAARIRPRPAPQPVVRFETAPGHQAQSDFAKVCFPWGTRFALLVVLGYSRVLYVEFAARQTALTVMLGLERAFAAFGGVPHEILFDQMKSVTVEDHRPTRGWLLENPEFLRFAAHWGFRIRAGRPYRAKTKGKVERRSAISAAIFSTVGPSLATRTSPISAPAGTGAPIGACMAPRAWSPWASWWRSRRPSYPWPRAPTAPWS